MIGRLLPGIMLLLLTCFTGATAAELPDLSWTNEVGARQCPTGSAVFLVNEYGAIADGITLNTVAIQKAIDTCAAKGGGLVSFLPGRYLSGSIFLKEGVRLHLPEGVVLLGSTNINDYPDIPTRVAGLEMIWPAALINVIGQKNVQLSGKGIVNGQGKVFWDSYWALRRQYEPKGLRWIVDYDSKRPRTVLVAETSDVTIRDLTFQQAGFWTIHILYSSFCTVDNVIIQNNIGGHGPSTDGIDIDSSSRILVQNSDIDCNDDNICLKSGRDADGLRVNRPTEYIVIRNCMSRAGAGLLTCGSETSGGIRYVLAEGLRARGTSVGFRFKSAMNRGGTTEHIYIRDVDMEEVRLVLEATMNWNPSYSYSTLPVEYQGRQLPEHWTKMLEVVDEKRGTPYFRNIWVSDVKIRNSAEFMRVNGSEISRMEYFTFTNIDAWVKKAGTISYARNWDFSNVNILAEDMKELHIRHSENVLTK